MKFYHATKFENLASIFDEGLKVGYDKVIYLCDNPKDCLKFMIVRGIKEVLVCEVELDEKEVKESFDHSIEFFQCRAHTYDKNIELNKISDFKKYNL